jgi:hypothetical protein
MHTKAPNHLPLPRTALLKLGLLYAEHAVEAEDSWERLAAGGGLMGESQHAERYERLMLSYLSQFHGRHYDR